MNSFTLIQRPAWSLPALFLLVVSNIFAASLPNIVFTLSDIPLVFADLINLTHASSPVSDGSAIVYRHQGWTNTV